MTKPVGVLLFILVLFSLSFSGINKTNNIVFAGAASCTGSCAAGWHCTYSGEADIGRGCEAKDTYCEIQWIDPMPTWECASESTCGHCPFLSKECSDDFPTCSVKNRVIYPNCCAQDTGPYCGDGSCNGSEMPCSCETDCGPCCTPSCSSPYCGQGDGCGGNCSSADAGAPPAPTLNPANGGTLTVTAVGQQVTVSWSAALADSYWLQLDPGCTTEGAYYGAISGTTYSFTPLCPSYYYRVWALNSTCATEWSAPAAATFYVRGTISGTVKQDDNKEAELVGEVCVLAGAGGIMPGANSKVEVGLDSGSVNVNGTYAVSPLFGPSWYTELSIGDWTEWRCTCPATCAYTTSAPKTGLDYFVANIKEPWWQTEEGNVHADGGNVRSPVPDTATVGYLITGSQPGLVSYTGSLDVGNAVAINQAGLSNWQAQTSYQGLKTDYGYFKRILEDDPEAAANGVTIHEGDYVTDGEISVVDGENMIILVNGEVTISANINVDPGGFLAIISSGNITIGDSVTNIEGVYVADGIISSGTSESQLIGEGIFTGWGGISLQRDFG